MTLLWPRLPVTVADHEFETLTLDVPRSGKARHPAQIYTPVGGVRATDADIEALIRTVESVAAKHGFPEPQAAGSRIAFDREAAALMHAGLDLSWSEAGQRGTWSFVSLVALPHITYWRFGVSNPERWVASDLTRHAWSRLWWQAVVFESDPSVLAKLTESDLNQLLERRSLGGDPRLTCSLARTVVERTPEGGGDRRELIRAAAPGLRRRLEFIDTAAMSDDQVDELCRNEVRAALDHAGMV